MLVTIIADASYCPINKIAGYGYWISSERGSNGGGGPLAKGDKVENSTTAEMMAIVNALYYAIRDGFVQVQDTVLLQSDCVPALDAFTFKRHKLTEVEHQIVTKLNQYMLQYSLNLRYRHVKGHCGIQQSRYLANNHCDVRAKAEMKRLRNEAEYRKRQANGTNN